MSYYLERIQRGVDYVELHLDQDVALVDVARAAGLSFWHFQRIFHALTGETLKTYVRSRRLAAALDRLLTTELRILDIALLAGYESQEAFARAFKKSFGLTPQEYRRIKDRSLFLKKPSFDREYLEQIQHNLTTEPHIYEQPRLLLVGLRTQFYGLGSEKNNLAEALPPLWGSFMARLHEVDRRVAGTCYGVVRQEAANTDRLDYHAAIEVTDARTLPDGMVALELPGGTYARFEHRGPAQGIDHTVSFAYATWLARSGRRHTYAADLEIYGAGYHPTSADSVFHYALPVTGTETR